MNEAQDFEESEKKSENDMKFETEGIKAQTVRIVRGVMTPDDNEYHMAWLTEPAIEKTDHTADLVSDLLGGRAEFDFEVDTGLDL